MGMSSHPDWEWEEVRFGGQHSEGITLPPGHTEGLAHTEGMTVLDAAREIYDSGEMFGMGLRGEWERLTPGEDGAEAFARAYSAYVLYPEALREELPERYNFIKEHLFYGYEFSAPSSQEKQEAPKMAYLDHDSLGRQIEVTQNGTWVVATGEKIS